MGVDYGEKRGVRETANRKWLVARRTFLKASGALLAGAGLSQVSCAMLPGRRRRSLRFGVVTDCHYADADRAGTRHYRESLDKLGECVELMNDRNVDFLIELGDFKDQNKPPVEAKTISYLRAVEKAFRKFRGPTYHALGNHDLDSISKKQFLDNVENTGIHPAKSYYSFDSGGVHFIVLDANYKSDGSSYDHGNFNWTDTNIPPTELAWLEEDLAGVQGPAIVFNHQLLDGAGSQYVKNAKAIRAVLQSSSKVAAVFQGHHHDGSYSQIEGIHYHTLKATVEGSGRQNNSYAVVEVRPGGDIIVTGYRKAVSRELADAALPV